MVLFSDKGLTCGRTDREKLCVPVRAVGLQVIAVEFCRNGRVGISELWRGRSSFSFSEVSLWGLVCDGGGGMRASEDRKSSLPKKLRRGPRSDRNLVRRTKP